MSEEPNYHARYSTVLDVKSAKEHGILVIGAGSIGSWLVRALVRTGFENVTVMDFDVVDNVNVYPQGYGLGDVGLDKVEALYEGIGATLGVEIKPVVDKFESKEQVPEGTSYIIPAVDSLAVRQQVFEQACLLPATELVLDARMGARHGSIHAAWMEDTEGVFERYPLSFDATGVSPLPCTERNTPFCGMMIGAALAGYVTSAFLGEQEKLYQRYNFSLFNPAGLLISVD
jgi:hypothetical protein